MKRRAFDLAEMWEWIAKNERKDHIWYGQGAMMRLKVALYEIERLRGANAEYRGSPADL